MEVWPSGAALRGEAPNHLMLRWLKTVVVSDEEKASLEASGGDQEDERCRSVENQSDGIKTGVFKWLRDEPGGCPLIGQVVSGMEAT
jgi:hypothetical protein